MNLDMNMIKRRSVKLAALFSYFLIIISLNDAVAQESIGKQKSFTCLGCHGQEGIKNAYPNYSVPKLGGQNKEYIVAALKAYQSGERYHPTMQGNAANLSEEDLQDIAEYFHTIVD